MSSALKHSVAWHDETSAKEISSSETRDLANEIDELKKLLLNDRLAVSTDSRSTETAYTADTTSVVDIADSGNTVYTSHVSSSLTNLISSGGSSSCRALTPSRMASSRRMIVKPGHEKTHLSEDTFAFLIAAESKSFPFFTGIVVVVIKVTMYSLIFADMLQKGSPGNALGIAASLVWPVAVSQFLAVAITVITQDDLITALQLIHSGYSAGIGGAFQHATFAKWSFAVCVLFCVGIYGLLVTFLLIITSSDVVDLILNFTAIEFISLLDNIVFQLSCSGFFGTANKAVTRIIQNTEYTQARSAIKVPWIQIGLLFFSFVAMMGGLISVFVLQSSGAFLPPQIIVQFDDEVSPVLSTYTGIYELKVKQDWGVAYESDIEGVSIGYCPGMEAWTFGENRTNYCENVMALSVHPTTVDISLILGQPWFVRIGNGTKRTLPMENVFSAVACDSDIDCGGSGELGHGICDQGLCECYDGFFGLRCNYVEEEVCDTIRVDEQTEEFVGLRRSVGFEFDVLRDPLGGLVQAYSHPVYVGTGFESKGAGESVDVILYTGLRWMLTSVKIPRAGLSTRFNAPFQASDLSEIEATTEIVRFNSAIDERPAPTNMEWFLPGSQTIHEMDPVLSINTVLVCSKCGKYNPCAFGNECNEGKCVCKNGETGALCQVVPVGDGHCDEFFNKQEFGYDGGDCCEASCKSGETHQCGVVSEEGLDSIPVGFPFCADPKYGCAKGQDDCWTPRSSDIPLLIERSSGAFVTLSANGRVIVVSEPELDTVRVFDQVDADWVQRGQTLEGAARSRFGSYVAMSTLPGVVAGRRIGRVPVIIAVATARPGGAKGNYVEVYRFDPHDTLWQKEGPPIRLDEEVDSVSVGTSGGATTLGIGLRQSNRGYIYMQDVNLTWRIVFSAIGSALAVAGDGSMATFLTPEPPTDDAERGSGIYTISNLTVPDPYVVEDINKLTLPNQLQFGTTNFAFLSRPVLVLVSYDGSYGAGMGQVADGCFSLSGLSILALKRDDRNEDKPVSERTYIVDRLGMAKVDTETPVSTNTVFAASPDTEYFAINSQENIIEPFHFVQEEGASIATTFLQNTSEIPAFTEIDGFQNRFAISDGGSVMAVVLDDHVSVVQRGSNCKGTTVRLALTLDEAPESVSWSLDYMGEAFGSRYPTENIANCKSCYGGDPRYTRVVVVEDFCVPIERAGCVQLTVSVEGRELGDGAGFIALADGKKFSSYAGERVTKASVIPDGVCQRDCLDNEHKLNMLMSFKSFAPFEGKRSPYPISLRSSLYEVWPTRQRSDRKALPGTDGPVLIQECLFSNETGSFVLDGPIPLSAESQIDDWIGPWWAGNWTYQVDGNARVHQTFDIGKSQKIEVDLLNPTDIDENIPARCSSADCQHCPVCPEGLVVSPNEEVDFAGFLGLSCGVLSGMGETGGINPEFCELYPDDIDMRCGCRIEECPSSDSTLRIDIEFDKNPSDIEISILNQDGEEVYGLTFTDTIQTPTFQHCLSKEGPLFFTIRDQQRDGLCCTADTPYFVPGDANGYRLFLDDELVLSREFPIGSQQEAALRNGANTSPVNIDQPAVWCAGVCEKCEICQGGVDFDRDEFVHFNMYGIVNCYDFFFDMTNYIDTDYCSTNQEHISSSCGCANHQHQCGDGESLLTFQTEAGISAENITVHIRDYSNATIWKKVGFSGQRQLQKFDACVPDMEPVYVGIYEQCGDAICSAQERAYPHDSFEILLDNEVVVNQVFDGPASEFILQSEYSLPPSTTPPNIPWVEKFEPCDVCGFGHTITNPDGEVKIPGSVDAITCSMFEDSGRSGFLSSHICDTSVQLASECDCAAMPTQAPSTPLYPPCNICGEGKEITILDYVLALPGVEEKPTCAEFAVAGVEGVIPPDQCPLAVMFVATLCGCELIAP